MTATAIADPIVLAADRELRSKGYVVIEGLLSQTEHRRLQVELDPVFSRSAYGHGPFWGETTKRCGRLLTKSAQVRALAVNPVIVALATAFLGCEPQLNLTQAIGIGPGAPPQAPHRDDEMWSSSKSGQTLLLNVMWPVDAFSVMNGATRIWPGTHNSRDLDFREDDAIDAVAPEGAAIVYLGETLHAGGANRSQQERRGVVIGYCADWLLPSENPWLAYPPEVACQFEPALARMIGYRTRAAGLNNWEGSCPSRWLAGPPIERGFDNTLSEAQTERVLAYSTAFLARHQL